MMQSVPQMLMPYAPIPRLDDLSRQRQAYQFPYTSESMLLVPQISHHRTMSDLIAQATKQTEPKPRLAKDDVQLLESEFQKNPKPTSQRKREIAEILKVDNARINVRHSLSNLPLFVSC